MVLNNTSRGYFSMHGNHPPKQGFFSPHRAAKIPVKEEKTLKTKEILFAGKTNKAFGLKEFLEERT